MNGIHRVCQVLNLGQKLIAAYQPEALSEPEFTGHHRFSDHDEFVRDLGMD